MPRKAKATAPPLRVEGLSDMNAATARDDFTGEPIPVAVPPIGDHREVAEAECRRKHAAQRQFLNAVGLVKR